MLKTTRELTYLQRRDLERFGERLSRFGVNFAAVDADGQIAVLLNAGAFESVPQELVDAGRAVLDATVEQTDYAPETRVWQFTDRERLLAVPLCVPPTATDYHTAVGVAIIDLGRADEEIAVPAMPSLPGNPSVATPADYFREMLQLLAQNFQTAVRTDEQMEKVGTELAQVYEELVLLHRISMNMRVTEPDTNFLQLACDSLTEIVLVEGIAVLLERVVEGERRFVVAAGSGLIDLDSRMASMIHSRLLTELQRNQEALLDSNVDMPWRFEWPEAIRNLIAVPLYAKAANDSAHRQGNERKGVSIIGYMVAINHLDKPDFDSTDIKLFTSVASSCAVFIENGRLFNDLKELFVGSLRALTSSIDAKDQYTRGHSERVALISRWLGERVAAVEPLDDEQIHRLYLAGLLHDIGKIGVDERVLRKNGKLTPEEREIIQRHPTIGASILRGIKQMRDIVPGVLCHHERMDGGGYPKGLAGEEIPLSARIIGLADSFDAMTSKRVYRNAMTIEDALDQIRKGLGTQFDEKIGTIFLESDIGGLWELIQGGGGAAYERQHLADYGTAAVGTLLR